MDPLIVTLSAYISQYFGLAFVWIVAANLASSHSQRYPTVSQLTLRVILIFFAGSLASGCAYIYLPFTLPKTSRDYIHSFIYAFTVIIVSLIQAVALGFIVAAIFNPRERA